MALHTLPTEILLEIFASLDYLTLKTGVGSTCRRFRSIINNDGLSGPLAQALFIDEFKPMTIPNEEKYTQIYKLHPVFYLLRARLKEENAYHVYDLSTAPWFDLESIDDLGFLTKESRFIPVLSTPMASENAFSPGVKDVMVGYKGTDRVDAVIGGPRPVDTVDAVGRKAVSVEYMLRGMHLGTLNRVTFNETELTDVVEEGEEMVRYSKADNVFQEVEVITVPEAHTPEKVTRWALTWFWLRHG